MKHTRAQKEAELLAAAEAVIEELLDWDEETKRPNLHQIEEVVLRLRRRFGERLAEVIAEGQEAAQPAEAVQCTSCGEGMRYKGRKGLDVESQVGALDLERGYYHCARCRSGFFPLDEQLELWDGHWSEGVVRNAVWLSGLVPYEQAETILDRIGGMQMSTASVWRRTQAWGAKLREHSEAERVLANALPEKWEPPSRRVVPDQRMGAAMDGTMIHIREEGWKELKVGTVFDVAVRPTRDERTGDLVDLGHAVRNTYAAHLGGPEILGELVWTEARRRKWEEAQDTVVIGDGAPWIWNQAGLHFGASQQLVDWYHAKQHLVVAAQALKGDSGPAYQRWVNNRETALYQGHAAGIADELCAAASDQTERAPDLLREAGYFRQHQRRMNYLEMREGEWPIGSGMVESAAKQYKARFCGPGMRWNRSGAENLLPVRTAILSQRYDQLWDRVYNSPPL